MTELQELKQKLEQAVAERNAEWNDGDITQKWTWARNKVTDLLAAIRKIELENAPKPAPMADWQIRQLDDMDWDED